MRSTVTNSSKCAQQTTNCNNKVKTIQTRSRQTRVSLSWHSLLTKQAHCKATTSVARLRSHWRNLAATSEVVNYLGSCSNYLK